jgi:hypothetical protein
VAHFTACRMGSQWEKQTNFIGIIEPGRISRASPARSSDAHFALFEYHDDMRNFNAYPYGKYLKSPGIDEGENDDNQ